MASVLFRDRYDAGRVLARALDARAPLSRGALVLGLPRGGVPVAYEVARGADAELDVCCVRKLGVPGHEELAMGAIGPGGVRVLNEALIARLGVTPEAIAHVTEFEAAELVRRERSYRGGRAPLRVEGRHVTVVDDGLATGATMHAAVLALRAHGPASLTVATPVGSPEACSSFEAIAEHVVCACSPPEFAAVGQFYRDFAQTTDDEVRSLLARARIEGPAASR